MATSYGLTCNPNDQLVAKYIREQEQHDIAMDKVSVKEYKDSFVEKGIQEENRKRRKQNKGPLRASQ